MESNKGHLETVKDALTKDHFTALHHWINRNIFGKVLYFPYGILGKILTRPHAPESGMFEDIKYKTRLKIYYILYGILQYFHYGCVGGAMIGSTVPFEQGDDLGYMSDVAIATANALLALHIRYNRKRVQKIMEMVKQIEEKKEGEIKRKKEDGKIEGNRKDAEENNFPHILQKYHR